MALDQLMTGYGGRAFPYPEIAGKYEGKNLIVCGDAEGIWIDLEAFGARDDSGPRGRVLKEGWDILTVNKIVETMPANIEHAYSNIPRVLDVALAARRDEYAREFRPNSDIQTHSCVRGAKWHWPWGGHGTSGLGAVLVGIGLGYKRIVLCGLPLDDGPHNGEPHWRRTRFASSEAAGSVSDDRDAHWKRAMELAFDKRVRSMSGRTKDWLGDALGWR